DRGPLVRPPLPPPPPRGGVADFAYTQSWVSPTEDDAVMITQLEFGYGLTEQLRLATDIEWQFAPGATDSRLGIGLEWMLLGRRCRHRLY
ncbi:MAG: hypothetical protein ACFB14_24175, partial [Leptolyngbyaceae cyanobacterium]